MEYEQPSQRVVLQREEESNGQGIISSSSSTEAKKSEYSDKDVEAAWTLIGMSEKTLDADTAKQLRILRGKIRKNRQTQPHVRQIRHDNDDLVVREETEPGYQLPRFPPTEGLARIIERCSQPIDKELTSSDLSDHLCKLTLAKKKVNDLFLPMLEPGDGDVASGIQVTTYDWWGKKFPMTFKSWNDNKLFVLTTGWKYFCEKHQTMGVRDRVIVWMFRHMSTKRLCFALSLVKCKKRKLD